MKHHILPISYVKMSLIMEIRDLSYGGKAVQRNRETSYRHHRDHHYLTLKLRRISNFSKSDTEIYV